MSEEILINKKQFTTPHVVVNNGVEALQFYEQFMDAKISRKVFHQDNKKIMHAELTFPNNGLIMLCDYFPDCSAQGNCLLPKDCHSPVTIHLHFENDELARHFWEKIKQNQKEGFHISLEYGKQFWNENYGKFEDKYGHSWSIGSPLNEIDKKNNDVNMKKNVENKKESGFRGFKKFGEQIGLGVEFIISKESGYDFKKACGEGIGLLMQHCEQHSLLDKIDKRISVCPDNPEIVKECRYTPIFLFKNDKISIDELKEMETEKIKIKIIPDLDWYVYEHVGAYSGLGQCWVNAIDDFMKKNLTFNGDNFFEYYVNDCRAVPEEELITWICVGVQNKQEKTD